jgi:hypothetical protein
MAHPDNKSYSEKSHVSLERLACHVCGKTFDSGVILFDKRLRPVFDRFTVTGYGTCPDCQGMIDKGCVALVGANSSKSEFLPSGNLKEETAYRTGKIVWVLRSILVQIIDIDVTNLNMVFSDDEAIEKIKQIVEEAVAKRDASQSIELAANQDRQPDITT